MVFLASRVADCLNVFVGLWLVPKYVSPGELGAVMPLTQFATCLAIPLAVFASTFRNEISELSAAGQFGRLKTLLRGTFVATGVFFAFAALVSVFILPPFLERIRIANGSLGAIIIAGAFVGSLAPIFSNALQALGKFKATSLIGIVGAPIRLMTMLVTMPLRALSGYFVGQASTPVFSVFASIVALRRELSVKAEPYWNKEVMRRVARFASGALIGALVTAFWAMVTTTILRQRLPDLDSSAYYMTSRFSEIAGFLSTTLLFTMFPFTAKLAREGKSMVGIVLKSSAAMVLFGGALAIFFAFFGREILAFLPHGDEYSAYAWAIPWQIAIAVVCAIASMYTGAEISAGRYGFLVWQSPLLVGAACLMLGVTGYGYFTAYLPAGWIEFLANHNVRKLEDYLLWLTAVEMVRMIMSFICLMRQGKKGVSQ